MNDLWKRKGEKSREKESHRENEWNERTGIEENRYTQKKEGRRERTERESGEMKGMRADSTQKEKRQREKK